MSETDWKGWDMLTKALGNRIQLVGDDLFVTNTKLLQEGIDKKVGNSSEKGEQETDEQRAAREAKEAQEAREREERELEEQAEKARMMHQAGVASYPNCIAER